jgi:hypothetical protein
VQSRFTRRALVKGGLLLSAVVPALGLIGNAAARRWTRRIRRTLFIDDVSKVDAAANPTYAPGQKCAFQGKRDYVFSFRPLCPRPGARSGD